MSGTSTKEHTGLACGTTEWSTSGQISPLSNLMVLSGGANTFIFLRPLNVLFKFSRTSSSFL